MMFRKISPLILVSLVILSSGCSESSDSSRELEKTLAGHFESLYLAAHGKDYPYSEASLAKCRQNNDQPCLDVYDRVDRARKALIALPKGESLAATLRMIPVDCQSENEARANFVCYGALMSLLFYAEPEQDAAILAAVKSYPASVQGMIFNAQFAWYHNRPVPQKWMEYVSQLKIDWQPPAKQQLVVKQFGISVEEMESKPGILMGVKSSQPVGGVE
ncbi:MAG: hypothetical protein OEZ39_19835 [Gammaproteobacteria bacterium]|nr:hypothetical protein [Gammaproteobacteria bacterium]MDH5654119.1 hypothetical protein [Gammaproteobacteria bacterium]